MHQQRAEALSLVIVDHDKGDLGLAGFGHDVSSAAHDHLASMLFGERDQGDVIGKIDAHEEATSFFENLASRRRNAVAATPRPCGQLAAQHVILVVRPQRADLDVTAVTQALGS